MKLFLLKTFGGLELSYYLRHFFFGLLVPAQMLFMAHYAPHHVPMSLFGYAWLTANAFTYPYTRFFYERVCNFILGDNLYFVSGGLLMIFKFSVLVFSWFFSIFIAPFGLLYLLYYHTRNHTFDYWVA